jgi:hypothetical protein
MTRNDNPAYTMHVIYDNLYKKMLYHLESSTWSMSNEVRIIIPKKKTRSGLSSNF